MKRKRDDGSGSIDWRTVDGVRVARVRLSVAGERRTYYAPPAVQTDDQAAEFGRALVISLAGTAHDPRARGLTLGAYGLTWLDARDRTHRDAAGDRQRWGAYIAGTPLAAKRLSMVEPPDLRAWAQALAASTSSRTGTLRDGQTIRNAWTTLRACLRAAGHAGLIEAAPLLAVELPRMAVSQHVEHEETIDALALGEIGMVLELDLSSDQRSAYLVGVYTGLRAGELHGLDWSRVDWIRREVIVARSRRASTKNGKIGRVPLLAPAFDALHERWVQAGKPLSGYVWPSTKAIPGGRRVVAGCHSRGFDWGWASWREKRALTQHVLAAEARGELRILERIGEKRALVEYLGIRERARIARPITFAAATRHTCACHLLSGSWAPELVPQAYTLEQVSRMLRHSSITVTERHYARWIGRLPVAPPAPTPTPGPALVPLVPRSVEIQAAPRIRTGDLRFTKPGSGAPESQGKAVAPDQRDDLRSVRDLAVETLRAIADGDRRALRRAADLAAAVLEATAELDAEQVSSMASGLAT